MNQISRWYNVDVTYPATIPVVTINGGFERSHSFEQVRGILEAQNVHFIIEKGKIKILP